MRRALTMLLICGGISMVTAQDQPDDPGPAWNKALGEARAQLIAKHGDAAAARIDLGLGQTLRFWRPEDGKPEDWKRFAIEQFVPAGPALDSLFNRLEWAFERLDGYMVSLSRDWRSGVDEARGEQLPIDEQLAQFNAGAHLTEDLFDSKIAFVVLLNFPRTSLEQRIKEGLTWPRRRWAETRMADRFSQRLPAQVQQNITRAYAATETYINGWNLRTGHLVMGGAKPFDSDRRLITHWGLRDEIKAQYGEPDKAKALLRQRTIALAMERIVRQEVPQQAIDNPNFDWNVDSNTLVDAAGRAKVEPIAENDERYRRWLELFQAVKSADPFDPDNPTFIARRFQVDREIPEKDLRALLEAVLASPLAAKTAALIESRLGRPLEPFDIWYAGFRPSSKHDERSLDRLTKQRYATPEAFAADMPRILTALGFAADKAQYVAQHVAVDPSRGAGHALAPGRRDDLAHLRTRVGADGMDYKGYNIAVHEFGHNVEQVFSNIAIDHTSIAGVPNNAFTEAMAFLFQKRDLTLLGLPGPTPEEVKMGALEEFWATREISAVALLDIDAWHWLYEHPTATPAEFKAAVVAQAQKHWNSYFAPYLHRKDVPLLAIYSHLVEYGMYTPDYAIGHLIAFQIEEHFAKDPTKFGSEFERMAKLGRLTPDAWMRQAVGAPLSAEPLLRAADAALR